MIVRDITEEIIHAYVDAQLSPDEHIRFERIMENDESLRKKVESYQNQNVLLHELFDPVLDEPVPPQLISPSERKKARKPMSFAAAVLLLVTGGLSGWVANEQFKPPTEITSNIINMAQTATVAHRIYTPEVKHPVEVEAAQEQHLVKWLSKRIKKTINAPSLNELGYALMGGRLLPSESGPAAQFMYENSTGNRLTLYVRKCQDKEKDTAFRYYEEENTNAFYWIDGDLGYVLVGNVNKSALLNTANSVYQQLSL